MDILNRKIIQKLKKSDLSIFQNASDLFEMARITNDIALGKELVSLSAREAMKGSMDFYDLHRRALLFCAPHDLDAYLRYLEWNREPEVRFYLPRRKVLKPTVDALQDLTDDKLDLLSISMPPGAGKSTLGIFFLTWIMGKFPNQPNLASAHSDKLTRSFYDGVLSILTDPDYLWADVFPGMKIAGTNSKDETVDLDKPKRFKTLTCRSIDGSLTGATRCEKILYADDLVSGIEEALSKDRLDNLWNKYTNDLKSRKKLGCKEIHIATRWSVHDVIGRLELMYGDDPRARFITMPALNENDESNFNYHHGVGFDTKYFLDMRDSLDDVSWRSLFMNEPIEREGLLFPTDELQYFNGVLPDGEPDRKIAVCDVAWGGGDSLSMPVCYVYGSDGYVVDVVFNKGDKEVTRPIVVGKIKQHLPHQVRFEANNGGDEYADKVDDLLREDGVKLNISHRKAPSNASKLSRIIQAAPDIRRLHFLDKKHRSAEYSAFMKELTSFMQNGKSKHDDAPDSLAMLTVLMERPLGEVEVFKRPF